MAFVYCSNCEWDQDDFYSENGYNPASYLQQWMKTLCSEDVDKVFPGDSDWLEKNGAITNREVIALLFEQYAKKIRDMKWITFEQMMKENPDRKCPKCGQALEID